MTPKEKAKELVSKYWDSLPIWAEKDDAKQCALIAVDEILNLDEKIIVSHKISSYVSEKEFNTNLTNIQRQLDGYVLSKYAYFQEVKQEIEAL